MVVDIARSFAQFNASRERSTTDRGNAASAAAFARILP
jgi:hypothetical protein